MYWCKVCLCMFIRILLEKVAGARLFLNATEEAEDGI